MVSFPDFSEFNDANKFGMEVEDQSLANDMEGGYVSSRPAFTRRPRRTFKIGLTCMSEAQRQGFEDFYAARKGGSGSFDWTHPLTAEVISVKFKTGSPPVYEFLGGTLHWSINDIMLEEI